MRHVRRLFRGLEGHHRQLLITRAGAPRVGMLAVSEGSVDHVALAAYGERRRQPRGFEEVVAFLQVLPERVPIVLFLRRQIGLGHAERKGVHLELLLPAGERLAREDIDLLHHRVGHGVAARGGAIAMHHQIGPRAAERAVVGVGVAHVEGEVVFALRIHQVLVDQIEPFRRLPVALLQLGPEPARIGTDRIGLQVVVVPVVLLLPDLQL